MLHVRAEGALGNARMKSQQRRLSGIEQVVGWARSSVLGSLCPSGYLSLGQGKVPRGTTLGWDPWSSAN